MSSCSCKGKNNIPKPNQEKITAAPYKSAFDTTLKKDNKKFNSFEIFLLLIIFIIVFTLVKDMKF